MQGRERDRSSYKMTQENGFTESVTPCIMKVRAQRRLCLFNGHCLRKAPLCPHLTLFSSPHNPIESKNITIYSKEILCPHLHVIGVHSHEPWHLDFLPSRTVDNEITPSQRALVDSADNAR